MRSTLRLCLLPACVLAGFAFNGSPTSGSPGVPGAAASARGCADRHGPVRPRGHHGHAAERLALLHPQERPAGEACVDAAGREGRIGRRERPAARVGALSRAHGVQRHAPLQGRRAHCCSRTNRRAHGPACQRLHLVRRDGLHVSAGDGSSGHRRKGHAGACRFRRRHDARSAGDRQGAGSGDRGVARRSGRRGSRPRSAHSRSVPRSRNMPNGCRLASRRS